MVINLSFFSPSFIFRIRIKEYNKSVFELVLKAKKTLIYK